jgi:hypothetical protein
MNRAALVLAVPDAEPVVGALRLTHDPVARLGVPAHVTLLFPFAVVDPSAHLAGTGALHLTFDRVAHFPDVAYLALADPAPVIALIEKLAAAFPAYPPYQGKYADIVPHLTIAHGDADVSAVAKRLPIRTRVDHATLLVEDERGHWHEHARYAL